MKYTFLSDDTSRVVANRISENPSYAQIGSLVTIGGSPFEVVGRALDLRRVRIVCWVK